jgi:putative endonuclease
MASRRNGTLYLGYTDNLATRALQHREKVRAESFTARHEVTRLVWYELHPDRPSAWKRERAMKKWRRLWKVELIERMNPGWRDLFDEVFVQG